MGAKVNPELVKSVSSQRCSTNFNYNWGTGFATLKMKWLSEIMRLLCFIKWGKINWVHKKSHTVVSPALPFWCTNIWRKKNTFKEENIIPRREEHGVMQTNSTNSELGRGCKKGGKIGKNEFLEQHLQQTQNKSEKLHPEKIWFGASPAKGSHFQLHSENEGEGSHLEEIQLLGSDIVSSPLGTISTCFGTVIERMDKSKEIFCTIT